MIVEKFVRFSTVLGMVVFLFSARASAEDHPSLESLIKKAPSIRSTDKEYRTIMIAGRMKEDIGAINIKIKYNLYYKSPDQYSLEILDGEDNTPLLVAAENAKFLYEPKENFVWYARDPIFRGFLVNTPDRILLCGFHAYKSEGESSFLNIDVNSFFKRDYKSTKLTEKSKNNFENSLLTFMDNEIKLHINTEKRIYAYHKIEFINNGDSEPFLTLDKIAINEPIEDKHFRLPSRDSLARRLVVRDLGGSEDGLLTKARYTRAAARKRVSKKDILYPELIDIDWDKFERDDQKASKALKETFKISD